jgi:hypothetical protein
MQISAPDMEAAFSNKTMLPSFNIHNDNVCVCVNATHMTVNK